MVKKIIKKWGTSFVLVISTDEVKMNNIKEGSILDIDLAPVMFIKPELVKSRRIHLVESMLQKHADEKKQEEADGQTDNT